MPAKQQNWPSTMAYVARLVIHRYAMLGVLDERGYPLREMGILQAPKEEGERPVMAGAAMRRPWSAWPAARSKARPGPA